MHEKQNIKICMFIYLFVVCVVDLRHDFFSCLFFVCLFFHYIINEHTITAILPLTHYITEGKYAFI